MTIPELKHSFDALEAEVAEILKHPDHQQIREFQQAWRKIFGRPVDAAAASAYLQVKSTPSGLANSAKTRRSATAASKRMKGGAGAAAALAGSPLDFQMRPGVDGVHGSFPPYISSGFSFYNTVNQNAMFKDCGVQDITPKIAADLGSNQVGGGLFTDAVASITGRPFTSDSAVPSIGKDFQDMWMGRSAGPSPAPEDNPYLK